MLIKINQAYKCETPYKGPYVITQAWVNSMVKFKMGVKTDRTYIFPFNTYHWEYFP